MRHYTYKYLKNWTESNQCMKVLWQISKLNYWICFIPVTINYNKRFSFNHKMPNFSLPSFVFRGSIRKENFDSYISISSTVFWIINIPTEYIKHLIDKDIVYYIIRYIILNDFDQKMGPHFIFNLQRKPEETWKFR